jgi:hypothetical protein
MPSGFHWTRVDTHAQTHLVDQWPQQLPRDWSLPQSRAWLLYRYSVLTESASPDRHDQVDGVEIFFTPEAPGQIGVRIDRCLKFIADGAQETEKTVPDFHKAPTMSVVPRCNFYITGSYSMSFAS